MHIVEINSFNQVPISIQQAWKKMSNGLPFLTYEWFKNLKENSTCSTDQILILCLLDGNSYCCAILPLKRNRSLKYGVHISSLTNYYSPLFDFLFDAERINTRAASELFCSHIIKKIKTWDLITLSPILKKENNIGTICESFKQHNCPSFFFFANANWSVDIESYTEYFSSRPSRLKNTYYRKKKKLNKRYDMEFRIFTDEKDLTEAYTAYKTVYKESWKKDEPYPDFIEKMTTIGIKKNFLRLSILYVNKRPVAAQIWFIHSGTAYIYKLAYSSNFKNYSVGTILTFETIKKLTNTEYIKRIDFLTGDDSFKRDWMSTRKELIGIRITNPSTFRGLSFTVYQKLVPSIKAIIAFIEGKVPN